MAEREETRALTAQSSCRFARLTRRTSSTNRALHVCGTCATPRAGTKSFSAAKGALFLATTAAKSALLLATLGADVECRRSRCGGGCRELLLQNTLLCLPLFFSLYESRAPFTAVTKPFGAGFAKNATPFAACRHRRQPVWHQGYTRVRPRLNCLGASLLRLHASHVCTHVCTRKCTLMSAHIHIAERFFF